MPTPEAIRGDYIKKYEDRSAQAKAAVGGALNEGQSLAKPGLIVGLANRAKPKQLGQYILATKVLTPQATAEPAATQPEQVLASAKEIPPVEPPIPQEEEGEKIYPPNRNQSVKLLQSFLQLK